MATKEVSSLEVSIKRSVQEGRFMPFLGAGASALRPSHPRGAPWNRVSERFSQLKECFKDDEKCQKYLDSQTLAHDIVYSEESASPPKIEDPLFLLQKSLVRLGARLVEFFGEEMARANKCVYELSEYQIDVSEAQCERLLEFWLDADMAAKNLAAATRVSQSSPGAPPWELLGADHIYEKLLLFTCRMIGSSLKDSAKMRDYIKEHEGKIDELNQFSCETLKPTLRFDELAWLEDLLWHTLRFDIPAYPSTGELTFRLSLTAATELVKRGDLSQVAEMDTSRSVEVIRNWMGFCEKKSPRSRRFHLSLAATLKCEYENYLTLKNKGDDRFLPIAFTTNYDRSLEKALDQVSSPNSAYQVIFPVYVTMGASEKSLTRHHIWVGHSVKFESDGSRQVTPLYNCDKWTLEDLEKYIEGPIIVKLHGSPLVDLPFKPKLQDLKRNGEFENYRTIDHAIILAESSYLRSVIEEKKYPPWLEESLKAPGRHLWFLGYSVSDWNVRLRLYEQLFYRNDIAEIDRWNRSAYGHRIDLLKEEMLKLLQIDFHPGNLSTFGAILRRIPYVHDMVESIVGGS